MLAEIPLGFPPPPPQYWNKFDFMLLCCGCKPILTHLKVMKCPVVAPAAFVPPHIFFPGMVTWY